MKNVFSEWKSSIYEKSLAYHFVIKCLVLPAICWCQLCRLNLVKEISYISTVSFWVYSWGVEKQKLQMSKLYIKRALKKKKKNEYLA